MRVRRGSKNEDVAVKPKMQEKQKLADKLIIELAKIGKQIENHYKKPQDIEWALEDNTLYIVQSRNITTLKLREKMASRVVVKTPNAKKILEGLPASPGIKTAEAVVIPSVEEITKAKEGTILVTKMTSPDWVPIMKKAAAIITDEGGSTCHAAIVSRELGIPCIVGAGNATKVIKDGQLITVDAYSGVAYEGKVEIMPVKEKIEIIKEEEIEKLEKVLEEKEPIEEVKEFIEEKILHKKPTKEELEKEKEKLLELLEKRAVKVKVNVALPEAAERAAATNADGVGLLRAEHMITAAGVHPAEYLRRGQKQKLVEAVRKGIRKVAELFKDKPIWYRTFDARTDEFRHLEGGKYEPKEDNPMLGWHGIRRSLDQPDLIKAEFTAIKQLVREGLNNLGVMLPFLINVEELKKAKEYARAVGLEPHKDVAFGVMIETPASVWIIDELIKEGIDFISFGTNDLTQLTLGIDRNNERIQKLFDAKHPAVLRQIKHVIDRCKKAGVTTSICGQAASDPEMVKILVRYGIDSVSANIDAVEKIKEVVLIEEKKILLEKLNK